jgi:hypothetical protein
MESQMNKIEQTKYDLAVKHHVMVRKDGREGPAEREFWRWCEEHNQPVIEVRQRNKFARVSIDLISTQDAQGVCCRFPKEMSEKVLDVLNRHSTRDARVMVGEVYSFSYKVPIPCAVAAAQELYAIWQEYQSRANQAAA